MWGVALAVAHAARRPAALPGGVVPRAVARGRRRRRAGGINGRGQRHRSRYYLPEAHQQSRLLDARGTGDAPRRPSQKTSAAPVAVAAGAVRFCQMLALITMP